MSGMRHLGAVLLMAGATIVWADTISLKDGRVFNGTYLGGTARQIRVDLGQEVRTFDISDVARIDFTPSSASGTMAPIPPPQPPPPDPDRPVLRRAPDATDPSQPVAPPPDPDRPVLRRNDEPAQAPPAPAGPVQLAAGTSIEVRMIDSVDSQTATQGQSFAASVEQPVVVNGQTAIPRGANAVVRLVEAKSSGTFTGKTELALALISVKVNDRYVPINTQTVSKVSDSRGEQTARVVGAGAAVGAVIGAIAGGGKGAAIGAGAGSAAGAGVQVATKGERVKIPSETRLTFTLDNAVSF